MNQLLAALAVLDELDASLLALDDFESDDPSDFAESDFVDSDFEESDFEESDFAEESLDSLDEDDSVELPERFLAPLASRLSVR
ncbi:MAG TPA: hypothetical protein VHX59_12790 [Mycobacteriales bacterium]|jgi:hypothetical protein|nr:hypothetical protein [Mycobacteriales bacterium]